MLFVETPVFTSLVQRHIPDEEYRALRTTLLLRPLTRGFDIWLWWASEVLLQVAVAGVTGMTAAHFRFDSTFHLADARWGDNFALIHQSFEEAGALHHTAAACPDRIPQARVYEPGRGLVDLPVNVAGARP